MILALFVILIYHRLLLFIRCLLDGMNFVQRNSSASFAIINQESMILDHSYYNDSNSVFYYNATFIRKVDLA